MTVVSSCNHIDSYLLRKSSEIAKTLKNAKSIEAICVHCGLESKFGKSSFYRHYLESQHFTCLHNLENLELYCIHCGDYHFSQQYDRLTGIKRERDTQSTSNNTENDNKYNTRTLRPPIKVRGLCNMGATCFMNSVLQILFNTNLLKVALNKSELSKCIKNDNNRIHDSQSTDDTIITNGCIACEMRKLFLEAHALSDIDINTFNRSIPSIIPAYLLYSVWTYADYMAGYEQQDAHEFLVALMDGLETHLQLYHTCSNTTTTTATGDNSDNSNNSNSNSNNRITDVNGTIDNHMDIMNHQVDVKLDSDNNNNNNDHDVVKEIFSGVMLSALKCTHCNNRSCTYERFLDLSLTLTQMTSTSNATINTSSATTHMKTMNQVSSNENTPEKDKLSSTNTTTQLNTTTAVAATAANTTTSSSTTTRRSSRYGITLFDCLQEFTYKEMLTSPVTCDQCGVLRECSKQLSIATAPPVLIIQLKRFNPYTQQKLTCHVDFPMERLDLRPYMSHSFYKVTKDQTLKSAVNTPHDTAWSTVFPLPTKRESSTSYLYDTGNVSTSLTAEFSTDSNPGPVIVSSVDTTDGVQPVYPSHSSSYSTSFLMNSISKSKDDSYIHHTAVAPVPPPISLISVKSIDSISPRSSYSQYSTERRRHSFSHNSHHHSHSHNLDMHIDHHHHHHEYSSYTTTDALSPDKYKLRTPLSTHLSTQFSVPDMTQLSSSYHELFQYQSKNKSISTIYDLYGLVCHTGSLHQGHYISYIKTTQNQWFRCDDDKVTAVKEDVVKSSEAKNQRHSNQINRTMCS